jgi:hypothetical protein
LIPHLGGNVGRTRGRILLQLDIVQQYHFIRECFGIDLKIGIELALRLRLIKLEAAHYRTIRQAAGARNRPALRRGQ